MCSDIQASATKAEELPKSVRGSSHSPARDPTYPTSSLAPWSSKTESNHTLRHLHQPADRKKTKNICDISIIQLKGALEKDLEAAGDRSHKYCQAAAVAHRITADFLRNLDNRVFPASQPEFLFHRGSPGIQQHQGNNALSAGDSCQSGGVDVAGGAAVKSRKFPYRQGQRRFTGDGSTAGSCRRESRVYLEQRRAVRFPRHCDTTGIGRKVVRPHRFERTAHLRQFQLTVAAGQAGAGKLRRLCTILVAELRVTRPPGEKAVVEGARMAECLLERHAHHLVQSDELRHVLDAASAWRWSGGNGTSPAALSRPPSKWRGPSYKQSRRIRRFASFGRPVKLSASVATMTAAIVDQAPTIRKELATVRSKSSTGRRFGRYDKLKQRSRSHSSASISSLPTPMDFSARLLCSRSVS